MLRKTGGGKLESRWRITVEQEGPADTWPFPAKWFPRDFFSKGIARSVADTATDAGATGVSMELIKKREKRWPSNPKR